MPSMSTSTARRKAASSPSSTSNSPSLTNASLPRLKLSLRNTPSSSSSSRNRTGTGSRTRTSHSNQRKTILSDSDSELTPADDDDDDDDEDDDSDEDATEDDEDGDGMDVDHGLDLDDDEQDVADTFAPRTKNTKNSKGKVDITPRTKSHSHTHTTPQKQLDTKHKSTPAGSSKAQPPPPAAPAAPASGSSRNITTTGPQGRERKRAIKVGDLERRRARDAKFDVNTGDSFAFTPTRQRRSPPDPFDSDSESSYGDDESDPEPFNAVLPLGIEREDDEVAGLPQAFAGQEIEDLAYGGGPIENEMERHVLSGLWEDDEDDEDEELFISQLSGSEAELQSQSSVHESDSAESSSDEGSSTDDEVDEFGYPLPSTGSAGSEEGPLVLMENWDGQFVLVQPRQERSRSRRRGSRGSRTAGSVGGSTVLSAQDQQALLVDADADYASSSEWSGMSDEDEDGGDTTDSMAEEDMPMLDSPALDQIIGEQIGHVDYGLSGSNSNSTDSGPEPEILTPSIVVTDTGVDPLTAAAAAAAAASLPTPTVQTPGGQTGPSTPMAPPQMGTFHPTTDDPAQHAVIDGSKAPTKSPFTHRRRSRRGRATSVSTTTRSIDQSVERKRKTSTSMPPSDPFFPTTLPKRARYSSIPGHPRYVAARRAAHAQAMAMLELETTSDEAEGLDLEDMLETELLSQSEAAAHAHEHHSSGFRFDRVPVSTYLRRNFGSGARREEEIMPFSSPLGRSSGYTGGDLVFDSFPMPGMSTLVGMDGFGLGDTLAGPPARMMLVSPGLNALDRERREGSEGLLSRKEKRRRKRVEALPLAAPPQLEI